MPTFPELDDHPVPSPAVICTHLGEQDAVLVDLDSDRWFVVNETGLRIWRELKVGRSVPEVARLLVSEYDVTPADARDAVVRMVESLRAQGLLCPPSEVKERRA